MGTGLGPESYALIEQGRIGQILSSRPTDRRAIIEEAAGITKFKTKKRLAEARLEDAKTNLNRVNDIFEEVTRQMNSLKRQASKAERYAKLRDEMRAKLRVVLASKFTQMDQESVTLDDPDPSTGRRNSPADRERPAVGNRALRAHAARIRHRNGDAAKSRTAQPDRNRRRSREGAHPNQRRALRGTDRAHGVRGSGTGAGSTSARGARRRTQRPPAVARLSGGRSRRGPAGTTPSASRKRPAPPPTWRCSNRSRSRIGRPFLKPSAEPPTSAISSRNPRSGWRALAARSSVCGPRSRPPRRNRKPSADNAARLLWNSKAFRSAPAA